MTPTDLFKRCLIQIGVLGRGQNVTQEQLTDAQQLCNMMLGQWAKKRWLIFHLLEIYTQGTGSQYYQLGPNDLQFDSGGAWDQSGLSYDMSLRTNRIEKAFVRLNAGQQSQADFPLQVLRSLEDYSLISAKNIPSGFPYAVYLDPGYPIATLIVWPAIGTQYELHVLMLNPLIRMNDLSTDINLPDEYLDALFWNLCRRLLNSYRKPQDPEISAQAREALNTVKNANMQIPRLQLPRELTRGWNYNIYSDQYN